MIPRKYFPLGKAYNKAFCNRTEETKWLVGNILSGKHSLLIAPRRYGKSSLAEKALIECKLPHVKTNFHLCTSQLEAAELIIQTVTKLIGEAIGPAEKIISSIKNLLTHLQPKLAFGGELASLELNISNKKNFAIAITESLMLIENLLQEKSKKAVIFFDEFQEISKIPESFSIEGAIRTAAQEMTQLSIVFSGSIRSLLTSMFEDENRPLYKLCRKLKLERISSEHYEKHLNKIAKTTWDEELNKNVISKIMQLTNRHPYYVNYLCDILWTLSEKTPTEKKVKTAWDNVIAEEWSDAVRELANLPLNQRKILKLLSSSPIEKLQSQQTAKRLNLASSTISSSINTLLEKDYIELDKETNRYRVINPLLAAVTQETQVN